MKQNLKNLFTLVSILILANHCSDLKKGMGLEKDPPDEFLVKKMNKISKPPNYDILPLPDSLKKEDQKNNITKNSFKNILNEAINSPTQLPEENLKKNLDLEAEVIKKIIK